MECKERVDKVSSDSCLLLDYIDVSMLRDVVTGCDHVSIFLVRDEFYVGGKNGDVSYRHRLKS